MFFYPQKNPWGTGIKGHTRNSVTVRSHACIPQALEHCSIHQEVLLPMFNGGADCLPLILIWCLYFNLMYRLVFKNVCKCWEKRLDLTFLNFQQVALALWLMNWYKYTQISRSQYLTFQKSLQTPLTFSLQDNTQLKWHLCQVNVTHDLLSYLCYPGAQSRFLLWKMVCYPAPTPNVVQGNIGSPMLNGDIVFLKPVRIKTNWLSLENMDK